MKWRRRIVVGGGILGGLLAADWLAASWLLWSSYESAADLLRDPAALRGQRASLLVERLGEKPRVLGRGELFAGADSFQLKINFAGNEFELAAGSETHVLAAKSKAHYAGGASDFDESRRALTELADALPRPGLLMRLGVAVVAHPLLLLSVRVNGELCWRIVFQGGEVLVGRSDKLPREGRFEDYRWKLNRMSAMGAPQMPADDAQAVEAADLDRSLAAGIRIATLQVKPVPREPDTVRHEGNGSLEIKDGRRVLRVKGKAYDIGFQHGRLLAASAKRLCERVLYGVGFYYSLEKGRWFLHEAAKLVERQRPYIAPEYFEEMRGLADGAGIPVAVVQAANIFPEFFHCSGAAVFGKAVKGGTLYHARVLDYMTDVGLQDEAVLMAIEREGARRIVNVSYAGFIGSVTGMNDRQVAIGEMGGGGEGNWDGTPMSQLLRGALENCDTLEQVLDYMANRPRTCEYYYVVSDGKSRTARGVAATPERFEVVRPGQAVALLPEPVEDAVLLSAGDRYKLLVKRTRDAHGRIGFEEFKQIVSRPVAMRSNLHNVIFEPPALTTWVANADRHGPACDQPYAKYTWAELFPE